MLSSQGHSTKSQFLEPYAAQIQKSLAAPSIMELFPSPLSPFGKKAIPGLVFHFDIYHCIFQNAFEETDEQNEFKCMIRFRGIFFLVSECFQATIMENSYC